MTKQSVDTVWDGDKSKQDWAPPYDAQDLDAQFRPTDSFEFEMGDPWNAPGLNQAMSLGMLDEYDGFIDTFRQYGSHHARPSDADNRDG